MKRPVIASEVLGRARRGVLAAAILLLAITVLNSVPGSTSAATPHAAGLVIEHGDGTVLYFYVQFDEEAISATDLLQRAGVAAEITPYGGLGQAVCRIDGEGCPTTNCFCKSYANPSIYWRYERLSDSGTWVALPYAASQKAVHDGDVIGFDWSGQDGDLPSTSLEDIARLNGVTRATPSAPIATAGAVTGTATSTAPAPTPTSPVVQPTPKEAQTPAAVGVKVEPSGTTTPVRETETTKSGRDSNLIWFGAGVLLIALIGMVAVIRRRGNP